MPKVNDVAGIIVTATPQEIDVSICKVVSLRNTGKADTAGGNSTSIVMINFLENVFSPLYAAKEGYTWLAPGESLNYHEKKRTTFWVRTDSGTAILMVAPENLLS